LELEAKNKVLQDQVLAEAKEREEPAQKPFKHPPGWQLAPKARR